MHTQYHLYLHPSMLGVSCRLDGKRKDKMMQAHTRPIYFHQLDRQRNMVQSWVVDVWYVWMYDERLKIAGSNRNSEKYRLLNMCEIHIIQCAHARMS